MDEAERPAKRLKPSNGPSKQDQTRSSHNKDLMVKRFPKGKFANGTKSKQTKAHTGNSVQINRTQKAVESKVRTFSQPSVICSGDKGIFVTSDKGREKKCLLDLYDLFLEYLEDSGIGESHEEGSKSLPATGSWTQIQNVEEQDQQSIEADIASEIKNLKEAGAESTIELAGHNPAQLITLDIPCVSFLRFVPGSLVDPVDVVHKLCLKATDKTSPQRSRYIKRLTPLSNMGKVLSHGLQKLCDDVLPKHFGAGMDGNIVSTRFAIRPSIRNNDKVDRDETIKVVASHVQQLGKEKHKVDLKGYEKAVIVEVYRGWVGMSVVDNVSNGRYKIGFEDLKKFNLAEIYANR